MDSSNPVHYFVCGGFGGVVTVLVGHPFDTVKVRLQTMKRPEPGEKPLYSGTIDCFKKTIAREGPLGLYKGMSAPLASVVPIFAISFMGYGLGKKVFGPSDETVHFTSLQYFLAGGFSGIFTTTLMAPGERIKTLLQIQQGGGPVKYKGPLDAIVKLYKEGGISSIYRGSLATLLRDIPAAGIYFLTYAQLQNFFTDYGQKPTNFGLTIFSGGMAGITHWAVGMPADVVKSRLQAAPEGRYPNGLRQVAAELLMKEGPLAFYTGIVPVAIRAFPANAACFLGFEICATFLKWAFSHTPET